MMKSHGFTLTELIVVVAIVAILAIAGIAAISKYAGSEPGSKPAAAAQEKTKISVQNDACTALVKEGEWKCTANKQHHHFVRCQVSEISGEKVTCRCFARVSLENICNPEINFSLSELNKKIKELQEDGEDDWEED